MKFAHVDIKKYTLPLARPLTVGANTITLREGIILSFTDEDGLTGYGEAAPLLGLHNETLAEVVSQILPLRTLIEGGDFGSLVKNVMVRELCPSVRLAVEMALFNLRVERGGICSDMDNVILPLNGLVMAQDEGVFEQIKAMLADGYHSVKIKVGRQQLQKDIETILALRQTIKDSATIRLDANRSWTLAQALKFCDAVGPTGIEYIEEPLQDIGEYPAFFNSTPMPIALDETLLERPWNQLDDFKQAVAFVLKPSLLGGFDATAAYAHSARYNGAIPVMSCTFQSDMTLRTFAIVAAYFKMVDTCAGLDTLKWFKEPLLEEGFEIADGRIDIDKLLDIRPKIRADVLSDVE